MRLCMNEATAMVKSSLVMDLEMCEKHGYDLIEIRTMDKLVDYLKDHTVDDLANYFATHNVKPYAFNTLVFFNNRDEAGHKAIVEEFEYLCQVGQKIGCKTIIAVPLVGEEKILKKDIKASCVAVLNELADIGDKYGMRVSVEFIGHPQATVNTFADAWDIVQTVNRDNVGITLDCFHFHGMGSRIEDLKKADGSKIFVVHANDTEDFPIGILTDVDRVWPGLGAIDLDGIFSTLKEIGYKEDMVSVELFRPEYYELEVDEAYEQGKKYTKAVVGKYFDFK